MITGMISLGTIVASPLYGFLGDFYQRKKPFMIAGALLTLASFCFMMMIKNLSIPAMMTIFFSLGFFSASQILGYPMITDASREDLKGTSMGCAALIIMGLAFLGQPLIGFLIDLASHSSGYNFTYALMVFPVGFIISLITALSVRESPKSVATYSEG
jgi:MFS family permease